MNTSVKTFLQNVRYAFRPDKPLLFARLAYAVFRSYVLRSPPLRYVDFSIGFECNMACEHCFATALQSPVPRRRMAPADYRRVAKQSMALGAVNFSFQGGEPLMMPQLPGIIKAVNPWMNVISVTTNGMLVTPEKLRELRTCGVDILTVSLDSGIPEEHDRFRNKPGAFSAVVNGIKLALGMGFRVTLGTVVTHGSVHSQGLKRLIELAQDLKVLLYFIFPVPAGRWAGVTNMLLTGEDVAYIESLTQSSSLLRTDFQANFGPRGCGAAKEILYITTYGDVLTCPFIHVTAGNVFDESVAEIRNRAIANPYFSTYHPRCLASTDDRFREDVLKKTCGAARLPLPWDVAFGPERPA